MLPTLIRPLRSLCWPGRWGKVSPAAPCCRPTTSSLHFSFRILHLSMLRFFFFPPELLPTALIPPSAMSPSSSHTVLLAARPFRWEPVPRLRSWAVSKPSPGWPSPRWKGLKARQNNAAVTLHAIARRS